MEIWRRKGDGLFITIIKIYIYKEEKIERKMMIYDLICCWWTKRGFNAKRGILDKICKKKQNSAEIYEIESCKYSVVPLNVNRSISRSTT